MSDYRESGAERETDEGGGRQQRSPAIFVLVGLLVGFLLGIGFVWAIAGNPFSAANEVVYTDVVVGSVTEDADQICWSEDPERRDAAQHCAILALDPAIDVPEAGDPVTLGIVDVRTPDGAEFTQVVHVAPSDDPALDPAEPADPLGEDDADALDEDGTGTDS